MLGYDNRRFRSLNTRKLNSESIGDLGHTYGLMDYYLIILSVSFVDVYETRTRSSSFLIPEVLKSWLPWLS